MKNPGKAEIFHQLPTALEKSCFSGLQLVSSPVSPSVAAFFENQRILR
jgi:hypothetical protein